MRCGEMESADKMKAKSSVRFGEQVSSLCYETVPYRTVGHVGWYSDEAMAFYSAPQHPLLLLFLLLSVLLLLCVCWNVVSSRRGVSLRTQQKVQSFASFTLTAYSVLFALGVKFQGSFDSHTYRIVSCPPGKSYCYCYTIYLQASGKYKGLQRAVIFPKESDLACDYCIRNTVFRLPSRQSRLLSRAVIFLTGQVFICDSHTAT
jgi:hypothetical protein